jgi:hypothetical protein
VPSSAKTIKDPILLANPFAVDDAQLFQEMDIDKAISIAEDNLLQTQTQGNNFHIGMTRRKLMKDGMMKGEGPLFNLLNKSEDEMASQRMGRVGAFRIWIVWYSWHKTGHWRSKRYACKRKCSPRRCCWCQCSIRKYGCSRQRNNPNRYKHNET